MSNSGELQPPTSSAAEFLTEAGMLFSLGKAAVVYVEGDSDRRLYTLLFGKDVEVIPADNFSKVEDILATYEVVPDKLIYPKILGVVDRDYRVACGEVSANPNLICSEYRDVEVEMLESPAFDAVVTEYASAKLFKTWPSIGDFKTMILESVAVVGRVRFYNHITKSGISFKKLNLEKVNNFRSHGIDRDLVIAGLSGSQLAGVKMPKKYAEVAAKVGSPPYKKHSTDLLRVVRGHDVFELIAIYFKKGYGRSSNPPTVETLESSLRIGFVPYMGISPTVKIIFAWFVANNLQSALRS